MGELHAELGVGSAMMWIVISTPGTTGVEGAGGNCRGAGGRGLAAVPVGGGGVWPGQSKRPGATGVEGAGGTGGRGRASRRGAERSEVD